MNEEHRQRRRQGRYYTPLTIVEWCWQVLRAWIPAQELLTYRVVDPSAGDGVFLRMPCKEGWIKPELALGIDLYPPEGEVSPFRYYKGDGLVDHEEVGYGPGAFDLVIGNPPFGDTVLREWNLSGAETDKQWTIWSYMTRYRVGDAEQPSIPSPELLMDWLATRAGRRYIDRLIRCPVEVLFLQRFLELCRPGGWCAVVLPDGILANARTGWLRRMTRERAVVRAVISLPKTTFQSEGTLANTSLVLLHCQPKEEERVYLAALDYLAESQPPEVYLQCTAEEVISLDTPSVGVWVNPHSLPDQRWDAGFWNPQYRRVEDEMGAVDALGDYIELLTYGPICPGQRPEHDSQGVMIIGQSQFTAAGLDLSKAQRVVPRSLFDPVRSRVQQGDLLFPRSGEGSLLRLKAGVYHGDQAANVSCFVDLLRLKGINPYYVWLVLKTRFLRAQIFRLKNGVGTPNLNFAEIRSLKIPRRSPEEQAKWEERYQQGVYPLQQKRVQSCNPDDKRRWGDLADQYWDELVNALEESLTQRF